MKQHSTKDFDFDRIGKRMPYTVPDGFFADLESKILAATVDAEHKTEAEHAATVGIDAAETAGLKVTQPDTLNSKHDRTLRRDTLCPSALHQGTHHRDTLRPSTLHRWFVGAAACIAVAALTAIVLLPRRSEQQPVTFAEVEQVFTQLSDKEQVELLALYQNDPFFNL